MFEWFFKKLFEKNDKKDFSDNEEVVCVFVFLFFLLVGFVGEPFAFVLAFIVLIRQIARFLQ